MQHKKITRSEAEGVVDRNSEPDQGAMGGLFGILFGDITPHFFLPLKNARQMVDELKSTAECSCGKPGCLSHGAHRQYVADTLDTTIESAETIRDMIREETIDLVMKLLNCECGACVSLEKSEAAQYN